MAWRRKRSQGLRWLAACLGAACLLASGGQVMAADWRLFGVESYAGYLLLKSENWSEQSGDDSLSRQELEESARLRLSSYVFHPRFLSLTADGTFTLKNGSANDSGLKDYSLALDILRENMLSGGVASRAKTEDLEDRYFNHYERRTAGNSAQIALRGAALTVTAKLEDYSVKTAEATEETSEDKHNRLLLVDSSFRPSEATSLTLRTQDVTSDDRRNSGNSSQNRSLDLTTSHTLRADQGTLSLTVSSWEAEFPHGPEPTAEKRLTLRERWLANWSKTLQSVQEAEYTRRDQDAVGYDSYRTLLGASKTLTPDWRVSGQLTSAHNQATSGEEATVNRLSGMVGYTAEWGAYRIGFSDTLGVTQTSSSSGFLRAWDERHTLPVNGLAQQLVNPNVEPDSIVIMEPTTHARWNDYCTITQSGALTFIAWKDPAVFPPGYEGLTEIDVEVNYTYWPSGGTVSTDFQETGNTLQATAGRELAPGVNLDASLLFNARTLPEGGTDRRYDASVQATLKRDEAEGAAGATLATERNTLFARGSLNRFGWRLSESYQAEFFPSSTGHRLETRASRIWGLAAKTNLSLEFSDQTYLYNGELQQGLTGGKLKATRLFNPFMRVEVECRAEANRVLPGDVRVSLDAKYLWRQGQLDLTAGYEYTRRTYDRYRNHRLYVTLIRAL